MNIKGVAIALSIMALLPVTIYWGMRVAAPHPEYSKYHPHSGVSASEKTELQQQYKQLKERQEKWYMIVSLVVGILAILAGLFLGVPFLDVGLIVGGSITVLIGSWHYVVFLGDIIKFIATSASLLALIFGAYRMFKK